MTRLAHFLALLFLACGAVAAPFADPFRPPRATEGEGAAASGGPRLESILIAPDRRIAVISGMQYTEGARFGDGRIVRITESEVVIRRADGDQSLKLFPQAGKRPSAATEEN